MSFVRLIPSVVVFSCFLAGSFVETDAQVRPVGKAVSIVQQVIQSTAAGGSGAALTSGDSIYDGRQLSASARSRGEFELQDETRLVLNANSSLLLDDLVVGSGNSFATLSLNAVSGAFRFISGNSPSDAYKISTAVSTLGIRGTAFDVYVGGGGETAVMLLQGRVQVCRKISSRTDGSCEELTRRCEIAISSRASNNVDILSSGQQAVAGVALEAAFPFAANQSVLSPNFRVRGASGCLSRQAILTPQERLRLRQIRRLTRLAPVVPSPDVDPPAPPDIDPPPPNNGLGNPGTSGETPGASNSANSNASDRARSSPGNSGNSRASNSQSSGNSGKSKNGGGSSGGSRSSGNGNGNGNGKGKGKGKGKS